MIDLAEVRAALTQERASTAARIASLTGDFDAIVAATADVATDDEHDPDGATVAFERSQAAALLEQARVHLADVDRALVRVGDGSYETCERCGGEIGAARLQARPVARTCIACASAR